MKLYGDLGKTAKKLLGDDFVSDYKVKIASKSQSATSYTIESTQSAKTNALGGELAIKGKLFGQTVNSKFNASGKVSEELTLENLGVDGLKLVLTGASNTEITSNSASAKIEFVNKHVATSTLIDVLSGPVITESIASGHKGFAAGAELQFNAANTELTKYDFAASYADSANSEMSFMLLSKASIVKASYSHIIGSALSVAGEVMYNLKDQSKLLTTGVKYALDSSTTVKTKLNTDGAFATAMVQKLSPQLTFTICSTLNVKELDKGQKLGLSIAYEA
mmetsp:Transcript_5140/g.8993  ORF Transcript_5140/g.8993 Transcript_5140/m.8993 type:complete len:278 (-) Transcript_5140:234-1067(-)